jgi:hypothetical protein
MMPDLLGAFARRLRGDVTFLASAMEGYARSEGLDGDGLAQRLGIRVEELGPLGLCRRPAGERFAEDVRTIARRFGIDETLLAEMVRRADALGALRTGRQEAGGLVAAARDRAMYEPAASPMAMDALPFDDEPAASPEEPEAGDDTYEDEPS